MLVATLVAVVIPAELLLPTEGVIGLIMRVLVVLALIPALGLVKFFRKDELQAASTLVGKIRSRAPLPAGK
jgi:hypothetical protein